MTDKRELVKGYVDKWLQPLGLLWWKVEIIYYDDPMEIARRFVEGDGISRGTCNADWRYGTATVRLNLPALAEHSDNDIEMIVVHELVHILVNEMREEGIDHEERVVTGLTKAFLWTRGAQ